ncbi:MAG: phage tail tube protein [Alphaproteobacteria bacterium]|nr:phage tail tube protein [Alphaproteobacteria bacterium]
MSVNKRRISMREGNVFLDGLKVLDAVKCEVVFTPEVTESRALKEQGLSRRWIGYDITGSITEYRSTPWLRKAIAAYNKTGATPEFTISAVQDDKNSDYYDANGTIPVTLSGVVLTGDISLINLDSEGELLQDEIEFGAAKLT